MSTYLGIFSKKIISCIYKKYISDKNPHAYEEFEKKFQEHTISCKAIHLIIPTSCNFPKKLSRQENWLHEIVSKYFKKRILALHHFYTPQWTRKLKKVQAKKLVKSNT